METKRTGAQCLKSIIAALLILAALPLQLACIVQGAPNKDLVISEVVASNGSSLLDSKHGSPDWIELYNGSARDIKLSSYQITKKPNDPDAACALPDVTIRAGGYVILYANKNESAYQAGDVICLSFAIGKDGETLALTDEKSQILQLLDIPALERDVSYARRADGSYGFCNIPTPNEPNATEIFETLAEAVAAGSFQAEPSGNSAVVINEIVSKNVNSVPHTACESADWVELYNASDKEVSLAGYTLCDNPAKADAHNLQGLSIPAKGYVVVMCCREGCDKSDGHICVRMGIKREGAEMFLFDGAGQLLNMVTVPLLVEDVSYARRSDGSYGYCGQPTPGGENTTDISDSLDPRPMDENAPVRISEVLPQNRCNIKDADGERNDWVELVCKSQGTALRGYYLSDDPSKPRKWEIPETAWNEQGYLLIFLSGKDRTEGELHANFSISVGESLLLYDANTNTVDTIEIPALRSNVSVGKAGDGSALYYVYPTPGGQNARTFASAEAIGSFAADGVYFSEVSATHEGGKRLTDWIELYNGGESVDLSGYYFSNDKNNLQKWQIQNLNIQAGGYAVVEATKHLARQKSGETVTFGISAQGTTLFLVSPEGYVVDMFETGVQRMGQTSGRIAGNNQIARVFFLTPTRGTANSAEYVRGYSGQPMFSEMDLYQSEAFDLTLGSNTAEATIYYTMDGSEPNDTCEVYSKPIRIGGNQVIRAVAIAPGLLNSDVITYHYLFENKHSIPVLCIAMEQGKFNEVNRVTTHSAKVEKDGFFSFYEADGLPGAVFPAGLKAKGRGTLQMSQKSMNINLRAGYGQSTVSYPFFPGYAFTEFSGLCIRNGGQDCDGARMADAFASRAVQGMQIEAAATRPVAVYINGKYHGLYDFGEKLGDSYLETHYGTDTDMVEIVFRNTQAMKGSNAEMKRVRAFADANNMSSQAKFDEYCQWVDVEYFTDYYIARTYFSDSDMGFNQKYWRVTDYSVKWRPIFYDSDYSMVNAVTRNMIGSYFSTSITSANGTWTDMNLFIALHQNAGWREYCVERYVWAICVQFGQARMGEIFDEMAAELETEMARHISRWSYLKSVDNWKGNAAKMRRYTQDRPEIALQQVKSFFGVPDAQMQELIAQYSAPNAPEPRWQGK